MGNSNSKFVNEYLSKISSLLENTDIFNVDGVEQFVKTFNELNKEFKAELLMEKAKSKVESEQQKLQMYFDIIEQVDSSIKSVIIQNYIESYNTLKERINTYFDKLILFEDYLKLCKDNKMPLVVFNMNEKGNIYKACCGQINGTLVK